MASYGVLMPIFALDNDYQIGSFGTSSKNFIDFLSDIGFEWWQMLPICDTDCYNSPYNSTSTYSINPFFIDLETLYNKDLITRSELLDQKIKNNGKCNYEILNRTRPQLLYNAFRRFKGSDVLEKFMRRHKHVYEFCEYKALSKKNNSTDWRIWTDFEYEHDVLNFYCFVQYEAFCQFNEVKQYAKEKGIKLMGDLPLYSSLNSSEVYYYPEFYQLDDSHNPIYVSGAKPDDFSSTGQCWGHPVYNWNNIAKDNYKHWLDKIEHTASLFDGIRLDHFRGFESYLAIPYSTKNALDGHFQPGPGKALFDAARNYLSEKIIVGEDLGITAEPVQQLITDCGFNNMRVFQYGLDENNEINLPMYYDSKCIAYTGTHDNQTLMDYLMALPKKSKCYLKNSLEIFDDESLFEGVIRSMYKSNALITIFPIQDVLQLDNRYVFNKHIPSIHNWDTRITQNMFQKNIVQIFQKLNSKYGR